MAAAESRMFTIEDTMKLIADKAKESDNFWVKVQRRAHPGAHPVIVATLSGANVQHFASPELWVPVLCGGGKFLLQAFHESDANKLVGGAILFPVDGIDVRDVDYSIFDASGDAKKADWRGPARLEYPKPASASQRQEMPMYGINVPPAPGSGDSATNNRQAWPRLAGGNVHREGYDEPLGQKAAGVEAERRILEKEKLDVERDRHRAELDSIRRAHDSELKSMEARLEARFSSKPSGPDPIATMMLEVMKQQAEDRRDAAKQAAEDRRAAAERQDRADARFTQLLEKMSDRKEKDPIETVKAVAELVRPKNDDSVMMKTMHNMAEMQSSMVGAAMDFVDAASRMQLGGGGNEDEPKWMKGVERLVKGVGKMAAAAQLRQPQAFGQAPQPPAPPFQPPQPLPPPPPRAAQPQPPPAPPQSELSIIDQIEHAIRQHHNVVEVAGAIIKFYEEASVKKALQESDGDFEILVQKRLGTWVAEAPNNSEYLMKLFAELQKQAAAAGFEISDADSDDEEDAEVEEAGSDDEGDEDEE